MHLETSYDALARTRLLRRPLRLRVSVQYPSRAYGEAGRVREGRGRGLSISESETVIYEMKTVAVEASAARLSQQLQYR